MTAQIAQGVVVFKIVVKDKGYHARLTLLQVYASRITGWIGFTAVAIIRGCENAPPLLALIDLTFTCFKAAQIVIARLGGKLNPGKSANPDPYQPASV